jgi:hypothetical protein
MGLLDRLLGKPTLDRFAARLIQAMRTAGVTEELHYEPAEHRILRIRDGALVGMINLDNMFRTYCETPRAQRPQYLKVCVRSGLRPSQELPGDFEAAQPDLRPKLWPRALLEQQRLRGRLGESGPPDLAFEPIGAHLLAALAYDWPESVQSINEDNLRP